MSTAGRAALRCYRGTARAARTHVLVRWLSAPLGAVSEAVPRRGRVLDVGCGHGLLALLLVEESPERVVHGVDVDESKIAVARRAAAASAHAGQLHLSVVPPGWVPGHDDAREDAREHGWDAIVVCDVLYLLGIEAATTLLEACAAALAPGGVLIVKEIDDRPAWKYHLARVQELTATRVAKVTQGEVVRFVAAEQLEAIMAEAGLHTGRRRLDRGYPHPHLLLEGRRA